MSVILKCFTYSYLGSGLSDFSLSSSKKANCTPDIKLLLANLQVRDQFILSIAHSNHSHENLEPLFITLLIKVFSICNNRQHIKILLYVAILLSLAYV